MDIIINADDFGLTGGINRSVVTLLEQNIVSSSSVMIGANNALDGCKLLCAVGLANRVGVHLQVTSSSPPYAPLKSISLPKDIPTLVDENGYFKSKNSANQINPEEVEVEWEKQIIKTCEVLGEVPSHINTHYHMHLNSELMPIYLKLAAKYNIPVRGGVKLNQIDGSSFGVKSTVLCNEEWSGKNNSLDSLKQIFLDAKDVVGSGVFELLTHPGFCDDDLMAASSWNTVRENDYNVLMELAEEGWLQKEGFKLIRFSDL